MDIIVHFQLDALLPFELSRSRFKKSNSLMVKDRGHFLNDSSTSNRTRTSNFINWDIVYVIFYSLNLLKICPDYPAISLSTRNN